MNILMLSWNFPPRVGGMEMLVWDLFHGLRNAGHEVRLVTGAADGFTDPPGIVRTRQRGLAGFLLGSVFTAWRLARPTRPDAMICGSLITAPAAWFLSIVCRSPFLVLVHGTDVARGGVVYRSAARFFLRRATRLVANSRSTRHLLINAGLPAERIVVIHPGASVELFTPEALSPALAELPPEDAGRKVLLSVGRLVRRKGLLEFVSQSMPTIIEQVPEALLLVVGDDATQSLAHHELIRDKLAAEVRRLGLEHHVRLLGQVSQRRLLGLYGRADLFILPCLDLPDDVEGFGIVLLEAALAGTPAVATRCGGIPDAVVDGETAVLADPGDFPSISQLVIGLLQDDARREAWGQAARHRAQDQFAWPFIVRQYEALIESCLATRR